jgi:hypothetical protein
MVNRTRRLVRLTCLAAAVAAIAASSTSAAASAPVPTGTWLGTTSQTLKGLDHPYTTKVVITAYKGRLQSVTGWVRMECLDETVWDARIGKSYRVGHGPKLSTKGHFATTFKAVGGQAVVMSGSLLKRGGSGSIGASSTDPTCVGRGTWLVKRRF